MTNSKFPVYGSEAEAKCFHCDGPLTGIIKSTYHDGHFQGKCACGFWTWFDMPDTVTLAPRHDEWKTESIRAAEVTYRPGTKPALE